MQDFNSTQLSNKKSSKMKFSSINPISSSVKFNPRNHNQDSVKVLKGRQVSKNIETVPITSKEINLEYFDRLE